MKSKRAKPEPAKPVARQAAAPKVRRGRPPRYDPGRIEHRFDTGQVPPDVVEKLSLEAVNVGPQGLRADECAARFHFWRRYSSKEAPLGFSRAECIKRAGYWPDLFTHFRRHELSESEARKRAVSWKPGVQLVDLHELDKPLGMGRSQVGKALALSQLHSRGMSEKKDEYESRRRAGLSRDEAILWVCKLLGLGPGTHDGDGRGHGLSETISALREAGVGEVHGSKLRSPRKEG